MSPNFPSGVAGSDKLPVTPARTALNVASKALSLLLGPFPHYERNQYAYGGDEREKVLATRGGKGVPCWLPAGEHQGVDGPAQKERSDAQRQDLDSRPLSEKIGGPLTQTRHVNHNLTREK